MRDVLSLRLIFVQDAPEVLHITLLATVAVDAGGPFAERAELGPDREPLYRLLQGQALLAGRLDFRERLLETDFSLLDMPAAYRAARLSGRGAA